MDKGRLTIDPRGLIFEAYRIEGISSEECRSVFLDWAIGASGDSLDMRPYLEELVAEYGVQNPDHPMTAVLREGLEKKAPDLKRRGGRLGRMS